MTNEIVEAPKLSAEELFQKIQEHLEELLKDDAPELLNMTGKETEAVLRIKLIREGEY